MLQYIQNYQSLLQSYEAPCVEMMVLSKYEEAESESNEPSIKFLYKENKYQEIQNARSFGFESFISGMGGFIGIFLGYSLLQVPQLLMAVASWIRKLKIHRSMRKKGIFVRRNKDRNNVIL